MVREKKNHTHKLYWFCPQEDLHPIVLRPLKTSTNRESSTSTMYMQFPNPTIPLNPTRERIRVETLSTHTNPW